jgi:hypothetical protein
MPGKRALYAVFAMFAITTLVVLPGFPATWVVEWTGVAEGATSGDRRSGPSGDAVGTSLHDSAKGFGESLLGGLKFVGRTVISPFTGTTGKVSRDADATAERLHKGAKGFGDGLYGGLKYTGRKIGEFFSDSNGSQGR